MQLHRNPPNLGFHLCLAWDMGITTPCEHLAATDASFSSLGISKPVCLARKLLSMPSPLGILSVLCIPKGWSSKGTLTVTQEHSPWWVMSPPGNAAVDSVAEASASASRNILALGINANDGGRITTGHWQHGVPPGYFAQVLLQQASLGQI